MKYQSYVNDGFPTKRLYFGKSWIQLQRVNTQWRITLQF